MPNIGPGQLKSKGPFVLARPEWLAVQCYVTSALNLPTDQATLKASLPGDPPGGMDQFNDLLTAYKTMHDRCSFWNSHTLPDSVSCASDIVHYNEKVPIYYGALTKLLPKLQLNPPDPTAVAQFKAILDNLSADAKGYADHAASVKTAMTAFDTETKTDAAAIRTLHTTYQKKLGDQSPVIQQLSSQITQDKADMRSAYDEYNHDVIVAATSAAYAWVFPAGTIAAGIVAGIYGKKATDALARARGLSTAIDTLNTELRSAAILMSDLTRINVDLGDIGGKIDAAVPALDKMRGAWEGISSDLDNIRTVIANDIGKAPAIIKSLGIDTAIADWAAVAAEADQYRVNAYITVQPPAAAARSGMLLAAKVQRIHAQAAAFSETVRAVA
jgi:hypothetical protein